MAKCQAIIFQTVWAYYVGIPIQKLMLVNLCIFSLYLHAQQFLAFSEGPVTLADIMKIEGKKMEPPPLPTISPTTQQSIDRASLRASQKRQAMFLSKWEPGLGAEGEILRPSIHHFCTHPSEPQLPLHMHVLSRVTHAKPDTVRLKAKRSYSDIKISVDDGATKGGAASLPSPRRFGATDAPCFSLPSKKRRVSTSRRSSRGNLTTPLTSSGVLEGEGDDIVSVARVRLKRELKESAAKKATTEKSTTTQGVGVLSTKGQSAEVRVHEGSEFIGGQRSLESVRSRIGEEGVKKVCVEKEGVKGALVLTGTRMEVFQDPGRFV